MSSHSSLGYCSRNHFKKSKAPPKSFARRSDPPVPRWHAGSDKQRLSPFLLARRLLLLVGQQADADVAHGAGRVPGGEPERPARPREGVQRQHAVLRVLVDEALLVDPRLDA